MRGHDQLQTPLGRRLFIQATTGILTTSLQLNVPIPKALMEMVVTLPDMIPANDDFSRRAYQVHLIMLDVNNHLAAISNGKVPNLHIQLARGIALEQRLSEVDRSPVPAWRFNTVSLTEADSNLVYDKKYHIYNDLLTANLWNAVRVHRGLLHEQLRKTLLAGLASRPPDFMQPEHTKQLQTSMDICYEMQADILASVPFHLGYIGPTVMSRATSPGNESDCSSSPPGSEADVSNSQQQKLTQPLAPYSGGAQYAPASGGLNVMWPLFYAATMDITTPEIQAYGVKSLRTIGEHMGIRQALVLARVLESRTEVEAWQNERPRVEEEDDDDA